MTPSVARVSQTELINDPQQSPAELVCSHEGLQSRSGIQAQVMLSVKASASETLRPGLAGMKAAEKAAPNAELVQMIGDLTALLAHVESMTSANQVIFPS